MARKGRPFIVTCFVRMDNKAIADIRLALSQNQSLSNSRFYSRIEATTGQRREAKPRGRPRVQRDKPHSQ